MIDLKEIDEALNAHINTTVDYTAPEPEAEQEQEPDPEQPVQEIEMNNELLDLIDVDIAVVLLDSVAARLFYFLFSKVLKKEVSIKDFELTAPEIKSVSKLLKNYLQKNPVKLTSGQTLTIGLLAVYGTKALTAFSAPARVQELETSNPNTGAKRGRPRMTEEEKAAAALERAQKQVEKTK